MKKIYFFSVLLLTLAVLAANSLGLMNRDEALSPISNLQAEVEGQKLTLSWDAPKTRSTVFLEEEFEGNTLPEVWTMIDADEDGYNWEFEKSQYIPGHNGYTSNCCRSASGHNTGGALTPDNYLVTKELNLTEEATLTFWIIDSSYLGEEHWAVYASSTGNAVADFSTLLIANNEQKDKGSKKETRKNNRNKSDDWVQKTVKLPAGTKYVAFRQYDSAGVDWLLLDGVKIESVGGGQPEPAFTYTIYCDGIQIDQNLTETTYTEENVAYGKHEYCVEVKYPNGYSQKVCIDVNIAKPAAITNLKAELQENNKDVKLSWTAPPQTGESILKEDFENGMPEGWTTIDADGDGHNWKVNKEAGFPGHGGYNTYCARSASYDGGALTPNNYLITKELNLPNGGELSFWIAAADEYNAEEHWAVYASSTFTVR